MTIDKVLNKLILTNGFISGEQISNELNISRNAVNKHIKKLRSNGWQIQSITNKGYKVISHKDVLHPVLFKDKDKLSFFKNLVFLYSVDSTVKEGIRKVINNNVKKPMVIICDNQESGLCQNGDNFASPCELGIYLSFVFESEIEINASFLLLKACLKELSSLSDKNLEMSFPKGIYLKDKRYASTLSYSIKNIEKGTIYNIVGLGMYTNYSSKTGLKSLKDILNCEINRSQIIMNIINNYEILLKEVNYGKQESY